MGSITFQTIFGGPSVPDDYDVELSAIQKELDPINLEYHLDLGLTIDGDFINVTKPTGLDAPRVFLAKKKVTGQVFINDDDIQKQSDHRQFLRSVIRKSIVESFERIKKKDPDFDLNGALEKVDFLNQTEKS